MASYIYIILAGVFWGIISVFVNLLKELGFNSIQCVAIRVLFSAFFLLVYLAIFKREQLKIHLKDIIYFIGTGVFSIVFFNYCYFEAIELISGASIPALLLYTAPIFVMLFSFFLFKEKFTLQKFIALFITIIGLAFITGAFSNTEHISTKAFLLGLCSGFGYALYSIFGKMIVNKYSAITITTYTFVIAAVVCVPFSGVLPQLNNVLCLKGIVSAVGLSLLSTVTPFLLYTLGLKKIEAGKAAILATIEPVVASIIGFLIFKETFGIQKILGILCIICAIIVLNVKIKKH